MVDKKGKIAALIIESMGKPKGEDASELSDKEVAAKDVMKAIKSDNAAKFASALSSFIKICEYDDSDEPSEEDIEEVE